MKKKIEVVYIEDKSPRALAIALRRDGACEDARKFCKGKSLKQAWRYCRNHWWMRYYLRYIDYHGVLVAMIDDNWGSAGIYRVNPKKRSVAMCKFIRECVKVR